MPQEIIIAGKLIKTNETLEIKNPYDASIIDTIFLADKNHIENAIQAGIKAEKLTKSLSRYQKKEILYKISNLIEKNFDDLGLTITKEAGKPISTSKVEVSRSIFTFRVAAEELNQSHDEIVPLDLIQSSEGRWGILKRFPKGLISAITPFNFPLNLVTHKLAPSILAGNPFILRPSSQTPLTALKLGKIIIEAGYPLEAVNIIPCDSNIAEPLISDDRIKLFTFTGSPDIGWMLKDKANKKDVALELGGNAGVIIEPDCNVDYAVSRCILGSFSYSGQTCISVQRIYINNSIYNETLDKLIEKSKQIKTGNPIDTDTVVGPIINKAEADRIMSWIGEAVDNGAKIALGGNRLSDTLIEPSILTNVNPKMKVSCKEIFGPVVIVYPYDNPLNAISEINNSIYGLQAGIFTNNFELIQYAFDEIEVGGLIINDIPSYRIDNMPYGGIKDSGMGREGIKYALEHQTYAKLMVINRNYK